VVHVFHTQVVANPGGETYFFPVAIVKAINGRS
jgi:hypothetical protein